MSSIVSHGGVHAWHSVQLKRLNLTEMLWLYSISNMPAAKTVLGIAIIKY